LPGPGFYFSLAPESRGFVRKLFLIDNFYGFVATGICTAFAIFVILKPLLDMIGNTRIEAVIRTKEDINSPHLVTA